MPPGIGYGDPYKLPAKAPLSDPGAAGLDPWQAGVMTAAPGGDPWSAGVMSPGGPALSQMPPPIEAAPVPGQRPAPAPPAPPVPVQTPPAPPPLSDPSWQPPGGNWNVPLNPPQIEAPTLLSDPRWQTMDAPQDWWRQSLLQQLGRL